MSSLPNNNMYSLPNNYKVVEVGELKGLQRKGKNGWGWLLEPIYRVILVAKTNGKIMVVKNNFGGNMLLYDYAGKLLINTPIYDIIFGENCLFIKTLRPSTGNLEWCLVEKDFSGANFLGNIEFVDRHPYPNYVNKGKMTHRIIIKHEDNSEESAFITLNSGVIFREKEELKEQNKNKNKFCDVNYGMNSMDNSINNRIYFMDSLEKRVVMASNQVGNIGFCPPFVEALLGGNKNISEDKAQRLINLVNRFENLFNSIALYYLCEYLTEKYYDQKDNLLEQLENELNTGWYTNTENGYEYKIYLEKNQLLYLIKNKTGKISVIHGTEESEEYEEFLEENMINNGYIYKVVINSFNAQTITGEQVKPFITIPYSMSSRNKITENIKSFRYEGYRLIGVTGCVIDANENIIAKELNLSIIEASDFSYATKSVSKSSGNTVIKTNIMYGYVI